MSRRRPIVKVRVERSLYEEVADAAATRGVPAPWLVARLLRGGLANLAGDTTFLWSEKDRDADG